MRTYITGGIFYLIFLSGLLFPEEMWGIHFIAFLPVYLKVIFIILPLPFFIPFVNSRTNRLLSTVGELISGRNGRLIVVGLAIAIPAAIYFFPVRTQIYGDSRQFLKIDEESREYNPQWAVELISPDIWTNKNQIEFSGALTRLLRFLTGSDVFTVYRVLGSVCAFIYILGIGLLFRLMINDNAVKAAMIIAGLLSGYMLLFFGHIEIYMVTIALTTLYMTFTAFYLRTGKNRWFFALPFILFFSIKSHSASFALVPAFAATFIIFIRSMSNKPCPIASFKKLFLTMITLGSAVFIIYYFFVLAAYNRSHIILDVSQFRQVFLPLIPSEKDLTTYTLFSVAHVMDYLNNLLFISLPALFIIFSLIRKKSTGADIFMIITFSTLFVYAALFFFVNPLLSMPRDWDLFSLPGPFLVIFAGLMPGKRCQKNCSALPGLITGLSLMIIPAFIVNTNISMLSGRLESIGMHVYKTYWKNSSFIIHTALMTGPEKQEFLGRLDEILTRLRPLDADSPDHEYAYLYKIGGDKCLKREEFTRALGYYLSAEKVYPGNNLIRLKIASAYYMLRNYNKALEYAEPLIDKGEKNKELLLIAIESTYNTGDNKKAEHYAGIYLKKYPGDLEINALYNSLKERLNE